MRRTLAAIVAAVVLITGCTTGQGVPSSAPASPKPAPATAPPPSPAPISSIQPLPAGVPLETGTTYRLAVVAPQKLLVTVPADGWFTIDNWFLGKDEIADPGGERGYDMTLLPYFVGNVYADPCHWKGSALDPPVGPTVDDLAKALVEQGGPGTPAPVDVTIGGYPGKKVELTIPDIDTSKCDDGDYGRWSPVQEPTWYGPFTYGEGQHDTVYILDVESRRWVIDTNYLPGTSAANLAELEQLVASIRFEP